MCKDSLLYQEPIFNYHSIMLYLQRKKNLQDNNNRWKTDQGLHRGLKRLSRNSLEMQDKTGLIPKSGWFRLLRSASSQGHLEAVCSKFCPTTASSHQTQVATQHLLTKKDIQTTRLSCKPSQVLGSQPVWTGHAPVPLCSKITFLYTHERCLLAACVLLRLHWLV